LFGQAEEWKQRLGVEEGRHADDLVARELEHDERPRLAPIFPILREGGRATGKGADEA
jgi:hypothetical protein